MTVRNESIDNIKGFLIVFVVFCHLSEPLLKNNLILNRLYDFIYIFHMPAFIFICGYMQSTKASANYYNSLVTRIIVPLAIFSIIYEIPELILAGVPSGYVQSGAPNWILWFLVSLLSWRLLSPLFLTIKYPIIVTLLVSFLVSSMSFNGYLFSISRTFVFFPFYMLGVIATNYSIKINGFKYSYILLALTIISLIFYFHPPLDRGLLYGATVFSELGLSNIDGIQVRACYYLLSTLVVLCIVIIGARVKVLSRIGRASIHVYLWHGFIVKFILWRYVSYVGNSEESQSILILFISIVLSVTLSSAVVIKMNNIIFDFLSRGIMKKYNDADKIKT